MPRRTNPIYERLAQNHRWPSMRQMGWIVAVLFAYNLTAIIFLFLDREPQGPLSALLIPSVVAAVVGWVLCLLTPLILSVYAAVRTAQDMREEAAQILTLTNLTQRDIARGYTAASLFRMRFPLALIIGSLPAMLGWIPLFDVIIAGVMYSSLYYAGQNMTLTYRLIDLVGPTAGLAAGAVGFLSLNLFAAALGTDAAVRWRRGSLAALTTLGIILLLTVMGGIIIISLYTPSVENASMGSSFEFEPQYFSQNPLALSYTLRMGVLCAVIPGLLSAGVLWLLRKRNPD